MITYKPGIDGVRALAVLAVIVYHAKFTIFGYELLPGGFLGVDIFFVISGFLITLILSDQISNSKFSFRRFYERRFRRLAPALLLVIGLTALPFYFISEKFDYYAYVFSVISALLFVSNFYFYKFTGEYGAPESIDLPFLHTWSLAVEEQFYILFPALLFLFIKKGFKLSGLLILSLISICILYFEKNISNSLGFYSSLGRFWEFGLGAIAAHLTVIIRENDLKRFAAGISNLSFLVLIALLVLYQKNFDHPGIYTFFVALTSSLLLITLEHSGSLSFRILSHKASLRIGLISYSAYLIHYPIFSFVAIQYGDVGNLPKFLIIIFTLILSHFAYMFVEQPFRSSKIRLRYVFLFCLSFFLFFIIVVVTNTFNLKSIGQSSSERIFQRDNVALKSERGRLSINLQAQQSLSSDKKNILIVGNSHGEQLWLALKSNEEFSKRYNFLWLRFDGDEKSNGYVQLSCLTEALADENNIAERLYNHKFFENSDMFIISTRYNKGDKDRSGTYCYPKSNELFADDFDGIKALKHKLDSLGKPMVLVGQLPEFSSVDRKTYADYKFDNLGSFNKALSIEDRKEMYSLITPQTFQLKERIQSLSQELNVSYVDSFEFLCDLDINECSVITDLGEKIYYDYGHWTMAGVLTVSRSPKFYEKFATIFVE